jgi:hypothetical protein
MVIAIVQIEMVQELTITATLGVTVMIITNKMLLPILLSYRKIAPEQARKMHGHENRADRLWEKLGALATREGRRRRHRHRHRRARHRLLYRQGPQDRRPRRRGAGTAPEFPLQRGRRVITTNFAIGVDLLQVIAEGNKDSEGTLCRSQGNGQDGGASNSR